jgi:hypothetical protein
MNIAIRLKSSNCKSLVQTAAARASREHGVGFIFENRGTNGALNPVTQGLFLAPPAKPFVNYPERKDGRKKNKEIDKDQDRQLNANHGWIPPQCSVITPQSRRGSGLNFTVRMKSSAFWSSWPVPLDCLRKRKSTSPAELTPMNIEVGSENVEVVGNAGRETGTRGCRVEAISNRLEKILVGTASIGRDRTGRSVSGEKIDGMPCSRGPGESEGFNSTERLE